MPESSGVQARFPFRASEILLALWLSLTYASRIAFDVYLFRFARLKGSWSAGLEAALSPEAISTTFVALPLLLLAVSLKPEGLDALSRALLDLFMATRGVLLDWRTYLAVTAAALLLAVGSALGGDVAAGLFLSFFTAVRDTVNQTLVVLGLAFIIYGLWYIVYLVGKAAPMPNADIAKVFLVWCSAGFFVATVQVVSTLIWWFGIHGDLPSAPGARMLLAVGYLKDTVIYSVISFFVGCGIVKFVSSLPNLEVKTAWLVVAYSSAIAIAVAVATLAADVGFAEKVVLQWAGFATYWPEPWQRHAVHAGVYVRDFGWLVPGLVAVFAWMWLKVARHAVERAKIAQQTPRAGT